MMLLISTLQALIYLFLLLLFSSVWWAVLPGSFLAFLPSFHMHYSFVS